MDFRINWILLSAYITFWNHPWTDRIKSKIIPKGFGTDFAQISRDYREEKSDVTLPWYQNFWITVKGSLGNNGDGNENGFVLVKQ